MGDRCYGAVQFLNVPPAEVKAVREVLDEYDLLEDGDTTEEVGLWETYSDSEMNVGTITEIATALIAAAPGTAFVAEDSVYGDWLADLVIYNPELGRFDGSSDGGGQVLLTAVQVLGLLDATLTRAQIEEALGKPWTDWSYTRIKELSEIWNAEQAAAEKRTSALVVKSPEEDAAAAEDARIIRKYDGA